MPIVGMFIFFLLPFSAPIFCQTSFMLESLVKVDTKFCQWFWDSSKITFLVFLSDSLYSYLEMLPFMYSLNAFLLFLRASVHLGVQAGFKGLDLSVPLVLGMHWFDVSSMVSITVLSCSFMSLFARISVVCWFRNALYLCQSALSKINLLGRLTVSMQGWVSRVVKIG